MDGGLGPGKLKLFLSHSSRDKPLARRLASDLAAAGYDVWLDQWQIGIGERFEQAIERGLEDSDLVLVLLSRHSVRSQWVDREWREKLAHEARSGRVAVLPVRADDGAVPDFLAQRSQADLSGGGYVPGLAHLLSLLQHEARAGVELATDRPGEAMGPRQVMPVPIELFLGRDTGWWTTPDAQGRRPFEQPLRRLLSRLRATWGVPFPGIRLVADDELVPTAAWLRIEELPVLQLDLSGLAPAQAQHALLEALRSELSRHAADFMDLDLVHHLLDGRKAPLSLPDLCEVLQRLLSEGVSLVDLPTVLQALERAQPDAQTAMDDLVEAARQALGAQITQRYRQQDGALPVLTLAADLERACAQAITSHGRWRRFSPPPGLMDGLMQAIRQEMQRQSSVPVLLTGLPALRSYLRRLVALEFPLLAVLSSAEVPAGTPVQRVGEIRWPGPRFEAVA